MSMQRPAHSVLKFGAGGALQSEIVYPGLQKIMRKTTPRINYAKKD
jgi:hypothetical protein